MKTKDMTLIAVMAALICIAGPLSVAVGPVPLSLASFAVYMAGAVLGAKRGTIAVCLYLIIGLCGVPVFSGFSGGFPKLIGVTGGYLLGYIPCAFLTGLGADGTRIIRDNRVSLPVAMLMGTFVLYLIGTVWFMALTGSSLGSALSICVVPFLPGDGIKILAVSLLAVPVRKAVYR